MRRLYIAMVAGIAVLFGLSYWKNNFSYGFKPLKWRIGKSAVDTTVILLAALYMPAMLIGWTVMWLTRPIKRRGIQVSLALILGILFGSIGGVALELLCILAIFSVDLLTGSQGVYGWWNQRIPETFMPYLEAERGRTTHGA